MITLIASALADAERLLGRLMDADEAERFRDHILRSYRERGLL